MAKTKKPSKKGRAITSAPDQSETITAGGMSQAAILENSARSENAPPSVSRRERIALLAYSYWKQRGCPIGSPDEDWFHAERDVDLSSAE